MGQRRRIGHLRRRVTIQSKSVSQDASTGASTTTWPDVDTVWASVEPLSEREFIQGRAELQEVTTKIVMRYRSGITSEMRCTWDGHIYDIESVIFDERMTRLTLLCSEAV